ASAEGPMVFAIGNCDRKVVDAGDADRHQPLGVEFPIFVAVAAKPIAAVVVPFVGKADGDAVLAKSPYLFDQSIVELALPLAGQESLDGGPASQEFGSVSPSTVLCVGERDAGRVAAVPGVFGEPRLLCGGFGGKRRKGRTCHAFGLACARKKAAR